MVKSLPSNKEFWLRMGTMNLPYKTAKEASNLLREGELVAFPTETVYGLGADATNDKAVAKIFEIKGRPQFNPLISHLPTAQHAFEFGAFSEIAKQLASMLWPGPITFVVPRSNNCPISWLASAGLETVAIRVPDHPVAKELLERANIPVAAPSANISGRISPTRSRHVHEEFGSNISSILEGGDCKVGLESTVLDFSGTIPIILRPGHITKEQLESKINEAGMTKEAQEKALTELQKYKMMSPMSAEASVVRGYIDWMLNIPWKKKSKIRSDLKKASEVLNEDHFGLEEVKERILEYLAVQKRVKKLKGPVLCLVGPPGVGKTSLGESIARATNRKFVRMSLGGVRDEAEIRGHRRTYIGSMPGRILQKLSKTGVKNPLFLLDEIDKMGMDFRGDPASALLEVLDPEQNHTFNDHYLEVDYDLSDIMFVCTANSMNIPSALLDRMEIITLPGYTEDEKVSIAEKYLIQKQKKNNGIGDDELAISKNTIKDLIRYFTREAGVRSLEREIAKICRKVVKKNADLVKPKKISIKPNTLEDYCGVRKFEFGEAEENDRIGQVTGLAWTQVGGELLTIEASSFVGKGKIIKTGSLGDVMQESIQAALSVVRSRSESLGIDPKFYEEQDVHIHVPEGATPKDGPSAGAAMATALTSVLSKIPVRSDVAMTGEITLRGEVLKIGGLKEKLLAARRGGIKVVLIPEGNVRDLKEIPDNIKQDLDIKPVRWIDEVLDIVLTRQPIPWEKEEDSEKASPKKSRSKKSSVKAH